MTGFFIPGGPTPGRSLEDVYLGMRTQLELEFGIRPRERRIFKLWARRGAVDCLTEVGCRDPVRDGTVMAIFDMGPHQPFVVWWQPEEASRESVREALRTTAYSTEEFEP